MALNSATPTKARRQLLSAAASSERGFWPGCVTWWVISREVVEVVQDAGELERILGDAAGVRGGVVGAGGVAVVARHRPHREHGDIGIVCRVIDQRMGIGQR